MSHPFVLSLEETQSIFAKSFLEPKPIYREFPLDERSGAIPCCSDFTHPQEARPNAGPERPYCFGNSYAQGNEACACICRLAHVLVLRDLEIEHLQAKIKDLTREEIF